MPAPAWALLFWQGLFWERERGLAQELLWLRLPVPGLLWAWLPLF